MISRECINLVQQLFPSGKLHLGLGTGHPMLVAAPTPLIQGDKGRERYGFPSRSTGAPPSLKNSQ